MSILQMQGICKSFNGVKVLKGVDLTIEKGEIHSILGENGAGKSTLMNILTGVIGMDQGTIVQDGSPNEILEEGTLSKVFHVHMERSPYRFSLQKSRAENPARL